MRETLYPWRVARVDDSQAVLDIYNETVEGGGHSPTLLKATPEAMRLMILNARRTGWPMWVFLSGTDIVGWANLRPMVWGTELCHRAGDFSVYISKQRPSSLAALQACLLAYHQGPKMGLDALTCWILSANHLSTQLAQACHMTQWGLLPKLARYGDQTFDVQIWGGRFDDAAWVEHMDAIQARLGRRISRNSLERRGLSQSTDA